MKQKRKIKFVLKIVVLFLIFCMGVFSMMVYLMLSGLEEIQDLNRAEINKLTNLNLSTKVNVIGAIRIVSLDDTVYLALEIPSDEIMKLFPEDKYKPSTKTRYLSNNDKHDSRGMKWFMPDSIKNFKSFTYSDSINNIGMHVIYDNSNLELRKMYILWFST